MELIIFEARSEALSAHLRDEAQKRKHDEATCLRFVIHNALTR